MSQHRRKPCKCCGQVLSLRNFYRHKLMADGHSNTCKDCTRKYQIENRELKYEHYKEYDRLRAARPDRVAARRRYRASVAGKVAVARAHRNYRNTHPAKYRAHTAVNNAIKLGKLKPRPCEKCGAKANAHHDDYSKPLVVRWLCQKHHSEHHLQAS